MNEFADVLKRAQQELGQVLDQVSRVAFEDEFTAPPACSDAMSHLFEAGRSVGLTDKEVIKAVLRPLVARLRCH